MPREPGLQQADTSKLHQPLNHGWIHAEAGRESIRGGELAGRIAEESL